MATFQEEWQNPNKWFDYFEVLGVKEDATDSEIKRNYRKLARQNHPDLHPNDPLKEENYKRINTAYQILSDHKKRKDYYEDYQNRRKMEFANVVSNYQKNPFSKDAKKNLEIALEVIINLLKNQLEHFDEEYQNLLDSLYNQNLTESEYENARTNLKESVLNAIKTVKKFKRRYVLAINTLTFKNENRALTEILEDLRNKAKLLSKDYRQASDDKNSFLEEKYKKYYTDESLFIEEFKKRTEKLEQEFDTIKSKVENDDIDKLTKSKLQTLLDEYDEIMSWLSDIEQIGLNSNLDTANMDRRLNLYRNIIEEQKENIGTLITRVDTFFSVDSILNRVKILKQRLDEYNDYDKLAKMIDECTLDEASLVALKSELLKSYNSLERTIVALSTSDSIDETKKDRLLILNTEISISLSLDIIFVNSWDSLLSTIETVRINREKRNEYMRITSKTRNLHEELQPAIDFILSIRDLGGKKPSPEASKKVGDMLNLCHNVVSKMKESPDFSEKMSIRHLSVYNLKSDCEQVLKTLTYYQKLIEMFVSYKDNMDFIAEDTANLTRLFKTLQYSFQMYREDPDNFDFEPYSKLVDELNNSFLKGESRLSEIEEEFLQIRSTLPECERILKSGLDYFSTSEGIRFDLDLDTTSYREYIELRALVISWLKEHSLEKPEENSIEEKLSAKKENAQKLFAEIQNLSSKSQEDLEIDWKRLSEFVHNLEDILDELYQMLTENEKENLEQYWQIYNELKNGLASVPTSEKSLVDQLKLKALELLRTYKNNKVQMGSSCSASKEDLKNYIDSFYDYRMITIKIRLLTEPSSNKARELLWAQLEIYRYIIQELTSLELTNPIASELKEIYKEKLREKQSECDIENDEQPIENDLLGSLIEAKEKLRENPKSEKLLTKYLDIVGELHEQEYLNSHPDSEDAITDTIRDIQAKIEGLNAKKWALYRYSKDDSSIILQSQYLSIIDEQIADCTEQLGILNI